MGMDPELQIPNIEVFNNGVSAEDEMKIDGKLHEYTFTIEMEDGRTPKQTDVIFYDGRFYVIGAVETKVAPYLEIEPDILWVFPDIESVNEVFSNTSWNVK